MTCMTDPARLQTSVWSMNPSVSLSVYDLDDLWSYRFNYCAV